MYIISIGGGLGNQLFQLNQALNISKFSNRNIFFYHNLDKNKIHEGFLIKQIFIETNYFRFNFNSVSFIYKLFCKLILKKRKLFFFKSIWENEPYVFQSDVIKKISSF